MTQWSPQQDAALLAIHEWMKTASGQNNQIFRLFGYAGTGKTTLAKEIADSVEGQVLFAAFTGKAASVLQSKGCRNAKTIHSLIYKPKQASAAKLRELETDYTAYLVFLEEDRGITDPDERERNPRAVELRKMLEEERKNVARPMFDLSQESDLRGAKLLIVDECSMVDERMAEDLMWFGCPILVLGDPAQLPPVAGTGFFTDAAPDFMLTEVHRQAAESPILRLANEVRLGNPPSLIDLPGLRVIPKAALRDRQDLITGADQCLVGRNKTRHSWNGRLRTLQGIEESMPMVGERLVCLRNNHDLGLLNGTLHIVTDSGVQDGDRIVLNVQPEEGGRSLEVECHTAYFEGRDLHWTERREAQEFDFGYAMTVHKSQGSQWDKVALMNESWCFRDDRWKWLYTGITRAAQDLTVILDD